MPEIGIWSAIVALIGAVILAVLLVGEVRRALRGPRAGRAAAMGRDRPGKVPAAPTDPPVLAGRLSLGDATVSVRLAGSRPPGGGKPYAWVPRAHLVPPAGIAPVCLGQGRNGLLYVDLARAPDIVAITGEPSPCRELATALANQVSALPDFRVRVVVVGDCIQPRPHQVKHRQVTELTEFAAKCGIDDRHEIVFYGGDRASDLAMLRVLARTPGSRLVPVVLGAVPGASWSLGVSRARALSSGR